MSLWEPQHLTTSQASTKCYRASFATIFVHHVFVSSKHISYYPLFVFSPSLTQQFIHFLIIFPYLFIFHFLYKSKRYLTGLKRMRMKFIRLVAKCVWRDNKRNKDRLGELETLPTLCKIWTYKPRCVHRTQRNCLSKAFRKLQTTQAKDLGKTSALPLLIIPPFDSGCNLSYGNGYYTKQYILGRTNRLRSCHYADRSENYTSNNSSLPRECIYRAVTQALL